MAETTTARGPLELRLSAQSSQSPSPTSMPPRWLNAFCSGCVSLLPGAAQGAATVLFGHPLDTAKTRIQSSGANSGRSTFMTMARMVANEGPRSLYRGATPPLIMEGAKRSLQFAMWDVLRNISNAEEKKRLSPSHAAGSIGAAAPGAATRMHDSTIHSLARIGSSPALSGAIAGGFGTLIGCPMHVIKIRTQYLTAEATRNAWTCTLSIARDEGIRGFYRGFRYNLLKDVFFAGSYLGLYSFFNERLLVATPEAKANSTSTSMAAGKLIVQQKKEGSVSSLSRAFWSGAIASMVTWVMLYPLDTVKTIVQSRQTQLFAEIKAHPSRVYRGLSASLLKAGPVSGISMIVYESVKHRLEAWRDWETSSAPDLR